METLREGATPLARDFGIIVRWACAPRLRRFAFLLLLYAAGLMLWMYIFDFAQFISKDWPLVAKYHSVLRDALSTRQVPYLMSYKGHYTDRFLALPEVPFSPQYFLLPWLSDSVFNHVNILLFYSVGFAGLLALRKAFSLSALPFAFVFMLFSFNGYIVSRTAVGHTMWYGCFFLPFFHLLVIRMVEERFPGRSRILLIFVLFLMLLQGSFLLYTWCIIYLFLIAVFNPRFFVPVLQVCAGSAVVGLFRFLPGAVVFEKYNLKFIGGYPSLATLIDALTTVKDFREKHRCDACGVGWWEFDCYVGLTGLGIMVTFYILARMRERRTKNPMPFRELDFPNVLMLVLCFGQIYSIVMQHPIPLISAQRISARMIIVPMTMLFTLTALRMQDYLANDRPSYSARALLVICMGIMAWELYKHADAWKVYSADLFFREDDVYGAGPEHIVPPDTSNPRVVRYIHAVQISYVISCCAILAFAYRFFRKPAGSRQPFSFPGAP